VDKGKRETLGVMVSLDSARLEDHQLNSASGPGAPKAMADKSVKRLPIDRPDLFSGHSTLEDATPNATPIYKWISFNELTH